MSMSRIFPETFLPLSSPNLTDGQEKLWPLSTSPQQGRIVCAAVATKDPHQFLRRSWESGNFVGLSILTEPLNNFPGSFKELITESIDFHPMLYYCGLEERMALFTQL